MNSVSVTRESHHARLLDSLRQAIQPGATHDILNHHWNWAANRGLSVRRVAVHRVFPRGHNGFVIKYQLQLEGPNGSMTQGVFGELVEAEVFGERQRILEKLRKSRRKQVERDDDSDAITAIPELGTLLRVPGYDEKLPGLMLRHQPKRAVAFLREHLGISPDPASLHYRLLNHRLGKRCVLRLSWQEATGRRSLVLRCLKEKGRRHRDNEHYMNQLWGLGFDDSAKDRIRVPRVLACDDSLHTIAIEDVRGEVLGETRRWPQSHQAAWAGAALAKLHLCTLQPGRTHGVDEELQILREWISLTGLLLPHLRDALERGHRLVVGRLERRRGGPLRLAHRDFYNKQLLHDGEWTTLIDFDTLCMADPALDIGNYLAHRELARITGEAWEESESRAFLDSYGEWLPLPCDAGIRAWRDAALLRLACLYAMHTGWETVPGELLKRIEETP